MSALDDNPVLTGLPRVGSFHVPESCLPFGLMTEPGCGDRRRPSVVEVHPALAAWLWCHGERQAGASWVYKGSKYPVHERRQVWLEMWDIILRRTEFAGDLPTPKTDDEFDAGVGYILGTMISKDEADQQRQAPLSVMRAMERFSSLPPLSSSPRGTVGRKRNDPDTRRSPPTPGHPLRPRHVSWWCWASAFRSEPLAERASRPLSNGAIIIDEKNCDMQLLQCGSGCFDERQVPVS